MFVNDKPLYLKLNSGVSIPILPYNIFGEKFAEFSLLQTTKGLKTYDGSVINPVGEIFGGEIL